MQLTTITQEMVDEEDVSLRKAFEFLVKGLDSKMISWASYGEYDMNVVHEQCSTFGLGNPFGSVHTNVKALFSDYAGSYGVDAAYEGVMGKEIDSAHHRGGDDVKNIATILGRLLNTK